MRNHPTVPATIERVWLIIATILALLLSQLPYARTWLFGSSMPFDGFFGFPTWFGAQLNDLSSGNHPFSIRSDILPGLVVPPYFSAGVVRLFFNLFLANDMGPHAIIQCVHIGITVLAVAALFSTFKIRWDFGLVAGLIFMQSGIQVSLSQHVVAHESLLYFITSLICLRLLILEKALNPPIKRGPLILFGLLVSTTSLSWFFHDPIHFFLPLVVWTVSHLIIYRKDLAAFQTLLSTLVSLIAVFILTAIAAIPTLLTVVEMGYVNKTQVSEFGGGQSYEAPLLFAGLIFPHVTAGLDIAGLNFTFGDANLFYFFMGSFTLFLNLCYLRNAWRAGKRRDVYLFSISAFLSFGFALGAGSVIHYTLCLIFPPLGFLRHNYYGLKCLYLLAAFGAAQGLQIISSTPSRTAYNSLMRRTLILGSLAALLFTYHIFTSYPQFLGTTLSGFFDKDLIWFVAANVLLLGLIGAAKLFKKGPLILPPLLFGLVTFDLLRPAYKQHFFPQLEQRSSYADYSGALTPIKAYAEFFREQERAGLNSKFRAPRVLPEDVFLWANQIYPVGVANVTTLDSQGSNDFERNYQGEYKSPDRFADLAEEYGIDYFWIGRGRKDIIQALESNSNFALKTEWEWAGALFQYQTNYHSLFRVSDKEVLLRWFLPPSIVQRTDTLFGTEWNLAIPDGIIKCEGYQNISLPFMWLSLFSVRSAEGVEIPYSRDRFGRIAVPCSSDVATLQITYPKSSAKFAIMVSVALKGVLLIACLGGIIGGLYLGMRYLRKRRELPLS